jgi:hypothetical protein
MNVSSSIVQAVFVGNRSKTKAMEAVVEQSFSANALVQSSKDLESPQKTLFCTFYPKC